MTVRCLTDTVCCFLLLLSLPAGVLAQGPPPVPSGRALGDLPPGEFQSYVSGIYEGHMLFARALKIQPIICIDPMVTRADLARLVLDGISRLTDADLQREASVVVFRVLFEKFPCPGAGRNGM